MFKEYDCFVCRLREGISRKSFKGTFFSSLEGTCRDDVGTVPELNGSFPAVYELLLGWLQQLPLVCATAHNT